jgi:hypothetical protein
MANRFRLVDERVKALEDKLDSFIEEMREWRRAKQ